MTQSWSSTGFSTNGDKAKTEKLAQLTTEHFQNHCQQVWQRTDRMFVGLMALQWLAGIAVALWITPLTWIGATGSIHLHVLASIFLGGAIAAFPIFWFFCVRGSRLPAMSSPSLKCSHPRYPEVLGWTIPIQKLQQVERYPV